MNPKSKTILKILKIIFQLAILLTLLSEVILLSIFFTQLFNSNGDPFGSLQTDIHILGIKINNIQNLVGAEFYLSVLFTIILATLLIYIFTTVLKLLKNVEKKVHFSSENEKLIFKISSLSAYIALISMIMDFIINLYKGNFKLSLDFGNENIQLLIFSGIIYIIGNVYQNAVQLQTENDLTI